MSESKLTELEQLFIRLNHLIRGVRCRSIGYEGLDFKSGDPYLTGDGYPLGQMVWYMPCVINDIFVNAYGGTPEEVLQNAIKLFEGFLSCRTDDQALQNFIEQFNAELKAKVDNYTRCN